MIKRLIVKNLNGRFDFDLTFNRDLNILVGQNGSGKTSLLKLMWYAYSGNIYRFASDVVFDEALLETFSGETLELIKGKSRTKANTNIFSVILNNKKLGTFDPIELTARNEVVNVANAMDESIKIAENSSIFMPTFRRVEGGFITSGASDALSNDLDKFSNLLKVQDIIPNTDKIISHRFVTSVSSQDIINTVTAKYSDISQELRKLEEEKTEFILSNVQGKITLEGETTSGGESKSTEETTLEEIGKRVLADEETRKNILNSMTVLSNLVNKILKGKKIQLTEKLSLGEGKEVISPDKLSFGEKQMLSFLCYNFFADDSIIFIDEPEMSLHVDWQRILFPMLMEQKTNNQFIVATHSPFIYAQYQDKQINLSQDKSIPA